jgi:Mg/Co/Ni transporter MgtE
MDNIQADFQAQDTWKCVKKKTAIEEIADLMIKHNITFQDVIDEYNRYN